MSKTTNRDLQATQQIIHLFELGKDEAEQSLDRLPGFYLVINRDGVVLRSNSEYARFAGHSEESVLFTTLKEIFGPDQWDSFILQLRDLEESVRGSHKNKKSHEKVSFEISIRGENQKELVYLWQVKIFRGAAREEALFYVFGSDVTELRNKEKQLSEIFDSIPVGILTCDHAGLIESHYSRFCENLFGSSPLEGQNLFHRVFEPCLGSMKEADTKGAHAILHSLKQTVDVFTILSLGFPKQIRFPTADNELGAHIIDVSYQAIALGGKVNRLLLIFTDRTEAHLAQIRGASGGAQGSSDQRRQREAKECNSEVLGMIRKEMNNLLPKVENLLGQGSWKAALPGLHSLKGNARLAGLKTFVQLAHDLEAQVLILVEEPENDNVLAKVCGGYEDLNVEWAEFLKAFDVIYGAEQSSGVHQEHESSSGTSSKVEYLPQLLDRLSVYDADPINKKCNLGKMRLQMAIDNVQEEGIDFIKSIAQARVKDVSATCGKDVNIKLEIEPFKIAPQFKSVLNDCAIHLISNAIAHGIEEPAQRRENGKDEKGNLILSIKKHRGKITFELEDDGRGFDAKKIRHSAITKKLITEEQAEKLSDEDSLKLIFLSGFSTATNVTEVAGRGVGLSAIQQALEELGGQLVVDSKGVGMGAKFTVSIDVLNEKVNKQIIFTSDFVQSLQQSVVECLPDKKVTAKISVASQLTNENKLFWGDNQQALLAINTMVAMISRGAPIEIMLDKNDKQLLVRIKRAGDGGLTPEEFDRDYPEFRLVRKTVELIIQAQEGRIDLQGNDACDLVFGSFMAMSDLPKLRAFLQRSSEKQPIEPLFNRILGASKDLCIDFERVDVISQSIVKPSIMLGVHGMEMGFTEIENSLDDRQIRERVLAAVEVGLKILDALKRTA